MVSLLERQVREFCESQEGDVPARRLAMQCSEKLLMPYRTAEAYVFAFIHGYESYGEYQAERVLDRGFDSLADYHKSLARKNKFKSFRAMQDAWARRKGYKSITDYKNVRKRLRKKAKITA